MQFNANASSNKSSQSRQLFKLKTLQTGRSLDQFDTRKFSSSRSLTKKYSLSKGGNRSPRFRLSEHHKRTKSNSFMSKSQDVGAMTPRLRHSLALIETLPEPGAAGNAPARELEDIW